MDFLKGQKEGFLKTSFLSYIKLVSLIHFGSFLGSQNHLKSECALFYALKNTLKFHEKTLKSTIDFTLVLTVFFNEYKNYDKKIFKKTHPYGTFKSDGRKIVNFQVRFLVRKMTRFGP